MNMHYRIMLINDSDHSLIVRYWTDVISEMSLCTEFDKEGKPVVTDQGFPVRCRSDFNITLYNNKSPNEVALIEIIKAHAPTDWFRLLESIAANDGSVSLGAAVSMLHQQGDFTV